MANVSPEVEPGAAAVPIDGRRARRERGRAAVVDALFELLQERHTLPGVEAIAERAGVSVSSVFRYFDGLDDLREHTIERYFERFAPLFEVPQLGAGPLRQRIARLVEGRLDLYDAIAPMAHIARLRGSRYPLRHDSGETRAGSARDHLLRRGTRRADPTGPTWPPSSTRSPRSSRGLRAKPTSGHDNDPTVLDRRPHHPAECVATWRGSPSQPMGSSLRPQVDGNPKRPIEVARARPSQPSPWKMAEPRRPFRP
jgi:AcrR family transcriptional regulator